jgi:hypothetical protein
MTERDYYVAVECTCAAEQCDREVLLRMEPTSSSR